MPPEQRVHVVEDPQDTRELAAFVAGLSDRLEGRAVVHPTPLLATSSQLAAELLVALGKSFDALPAERCSAPGMGTGRHLDRRGTRPPPLRAPISSLAACLVPGA